MQEATDGGWSGASYLQNMDSQAQTVKTDLCALIDKEAERVDTQLETAIVKECKRVVRVAGGGDKLDWKKDATGEEKSTDPEFVAKAKQLEKTFHEEDFVERKKHLQKEPP